MKKVWYELQDLLVLGADHVSEHLLWYLRNVIEYVDKNQALAVMSLCKNRPTYNGSDIWGQHFPELAGIAVNLEHHFFEALNEIQVEDDEDDPKKRSAMHTSIRLMILVSLTDTVIHETLHQLGMSEDECRKVAEQYAWACAETIDPEIQSFGPVIDDLVNDLHTSIREDIDSGDPNRSKDWKRVQLHILDNNVAFYRPKGNVEVRTFRRAMAYHSMEDREWIPTTSDRFNSFHVITPAGDKEAGPVETSNAEPMFGGDTTTLPQMKEAPVEPVDEDELTGFGDDSLDESDFYADDLEQYYVDEEEVAYSDTSTVEAVETVKQSTPKATTGPMSTADIYRIAEKVLMEAFTHVHSKCGFEKGYWKNAGAVLQPVDISGIAGANSLFVKQDEVNEMGQFKPRQPIARFVKGNLSRQHLPQYKLYLNINGVERKRTFIAQNPNKPAPEFAHLYYKEGTKTVDPNKKVKYEHLSTWAKQVQDGDIIMLLLPEEGGKPLAHAKLANGSTLPEFSFWGAK